MREENVNKLLQMMESVQAWGDGEFPIIWQKMLQYDLVILSSLTVMSIVFMLLSIFGVKKAQKTYRETDNFEQQGFCLGIIIISIIVFIIMFFVFTAAFAGVVQILMAPELYLLQYFNDLI